VREVYVASYERQEQNWQEIAAPDVLAPALVTAPAGSGWYGAGNGFAVDADLASRLNLMGADPAVRATARAVGELALPRMAAGMGVSAREARPLYVRHRVALTTAERDAGVRL
jgi:tRNA threonylcarbamoyladenosine biosynthesis protein TsaB